MQSRRTRLAIYAAFLASLALGACGGGGGGGGGGGTVGTGSVSGTVFMPPTDSSIGDIVENEPNDTIDQTQLLGNLVAGQRIVVHGHTTELGSDPFDGFRVLTPERVRVTVTLEFPDAVTNDFDMGIWDLGSMQYVELFLATTAPEIGEFHAKGVFDIVVTAYTGEGDYVLTIQGDPVVPPIPEREPNDSADYGQWVGEVVFGDSVQLAGSLDVLDASDYVLVNCPASVQLDFTLTMPGGADYDLYVYDAADLFNPASIGSFTATTPPETGSVDVVAGTLVAVQVYRFEGAGPWTLAIASAPFSPLVQKPDAGIARGVAPLRSETLAWRGKGDALAFYGEPVREFVPGEALVGFFPAAAGDAAGKLALRAGKVVEGVAGGATRVAVEIPQGLSATDQARCTLARVAGLQTMPGVRYAEPNGILRACATPNDPNYNLQWHLPLIHLPEAWNLTTGSSSVIVAVIDTGWTDHPDLAGRRLGGYDFISSSTSGLDGNGLDPDPTDVGDGDPANGDPSSFHGTHVAGTIGASTNNGQGVAGVTWSTMIMPLRVLGAGGSGTYADIANAIRYAARLSNSSNTLPPQRAHVINMSLGGPGLSITVQDACTAARNAGVTIIAAAGNESSDADFSPAGLSGVISVASVDQLRGLAYYSNYGPKVDIAAPGGDTTADWNGDGRPDGVLSTLKRDDGSYVYEWYQGTSMAAPHVAGVAALLYAADPSLTPTEVESILTSTAEDLGTPGRDDLFGHGLVNAYRAVLAAQGGTPNPPALSVSPTSLDMGTTLSTVDVYVTNSGGGLLNVGAPLVSTQSGGPWLSAAVFGTGDSTRNVNGVRITVNRAGLPADSYFGRVTIPSNGGSEDVEVIFTVLAAPPPPLDLDIYVLAVDADTNQTVKQQIVNPITGLGFLLDDLPVGEYFLYAGTDFDNDGYICDEGEWCGAWPVEGGAQRVTVTLNQDTGGLEFNVAPDAEITSASAGAPPAGAPCPGFQRMR